MNCEIDVILSIHNPNKLWLEKQLTSIGIQSLMPKRLIVRLDGDTEIPKFPREIRKFAQILEDKTNVGFSKSFFRLMGHTDAEYLLFCDQDDVWLENKIRNLIRLQQKTSGPTLTFCKFQAIDGNGLALKFSQHVPKKITKFSFLFSNGVPGNSMMLNHALTVLVKESVALVGVPNWHDWWCLSIAREFGRVLTSNSKDVMYRIHENNVVGLKVKKKLRLSKLIRFDGNSDWLIQVEMLLSYMEQSNRHSPNMEFLKLVMQNHSKSKITRLAFLLRNGIAKSDPIDFLQAIKHYVIR